MTEAPIISIFRAAGGPPVANGVLVTAGNVRAEEAGEFSAEPFSAGLFSPWPDSLDENEPFGVYIPESQEWLIPDIVEVLALPDKAGLRSLAAVALKSEPALPSPLATLDGIRSLDELIELAETRTDSDGLWVDALKGANPEVLEPLGRLARAAQGQDPTAVSRPAGVTGQPETRSVAAAADRYFSLLCRILLRD